MPNAAMNLASPSQVVVDQTKTEVAVPSATLAAGSSFAVVAVPSAKGKYAYLALELRVCRRRSHYLGTGHSLARPPIGSVLPFIEEVTLALTGGEHGFLSFEHCNRTFFWKCDYYNKEMDGGSEDPADPEQTIRVGTLMLNEDY
jgi:hypothetical protein